MRRRNIVAAAIFAAGLLPLPSVPVHAADAIKLGILYNVTGNQASIDGPSLNGAKLAAKQINDTGGVLGKQLDLAIYDGKSDASTITTVTSQLINSDKVVAIVGLNDTDAVLAAAPQFEKAAIPFITPGATSPKLPSQAGKELFLGCFGDNVQAGAGAEYALKTLKFRTAYLWTDTSAEYTTLLSAYFTKAFEHGGGKILAKDSYKTGDKSFTAQITKLKASKPKPDFLYVAANPDDIGLVVKQLRQAGVKLPVFGGDGYDTPLLLDVGGEAANNVYFTTHSFLGENTTAPIKAFKTAYKAAYNADPENVFVALAYDGVKLMADAIKRAGSADPAKIRDALAATKGFPGITGTISYAPGKAIPDKTVTIIHVKDRMLTLGAELTPAFIPDP